MTRFLLLRHAAHDLAGRALAGRLPGIGLNQLGQRQARQLAETLARTDPRPSVVYSSPQQRTRETAQPVAHRLELALHIAPEFDEIDFGDWTGKGFDELKQHDARRWHLWCDRRSQAAAPGGEAFAAVAQRAGQGLARLARQHQGQCVLVVSHADVIKAVIASQLGMSFDHLERFEISCASLSVVEVGAGWSRLLGLNMIAIDESIRAVHADVC